MIAPPLTPEEDARIAALRRLLTLRHAAESSFDDITHLAAGITRRPIALVSVWPEPMPPASSGSSRGLRIDGETPRELAFCAHAIVGYDAPSSKCQTRRSTAVPATTCTCWRAERGHTPALC
ncbi:MAG: hypothetical protein H6699_11325 [Myxococcales bacterium]|nr:hypothetical protein [Myxococcales bacterium]